MLSPVKKNRVTMYSHNQLGNCLATEMKLVPFLVLAGQRPPGNRDEVGPIFALSWQPRDRLADLTVRCLPQ